MTRPSAETKEPEPPLLKRTDDCCTCSSHLLVGSKLYFFLRVSRGGWLNNHMPSSARARDASSSNPSVRQGSRRYMVSCSLNLFDRASHGEQSSRTVGQFSDVPRRRAAAGPCPCRPATGKPSGRRRRPTRASRIVAA